MCTGEIVECLVKVERNILMTVLTCDEWLLANGEGHDGCVVVWRGNIMSFQLGD